MRVGLENTTFLLHKNVRIAGIIRVAGMIRGRALYEEIRYLVIEYPLEGHEYELSLYQDCNIRIESEFNAYILTSRNKINTEHFCKEGILFSSGFKF